MSLMTSKTMDRAQYGRRMKLSDHRPVPLRWQYVLELHLAGRSAAEIMDLTNYSSAQMYRILQDPRVVELKQQKMAFYDEQFKDLYPKVIEVVKESLNDNEAKIRNEAAKIWLKAHGRFGTDHSDGETKITAEQIVVNILNEARAKMK